MDHLISVREYSELKLENVRLRNELDAQKQIYERLLQDVKTLLSDTSQLYINEINRLHTIIGDKDHAEIPPPPNVPSVPSISTSTSCHTENPIKEKPIRSKQPSNPVDRSNCIQEHSKRQTRTQSLISFTESFSSLRKAVLSSLQKNGLEELIYITLSPRFTEDNILQVIDCVYTAMQQSLSLLKSFDMTDLFKRVELFSSLLFYLTTRFPASSSTDYCLQKLQEELLSELQQTYSHLKYDRFPPAYIGLVLVYLNLCRYLDAVELFKLLLYNIMIKAGEFPSRMVYFLYRHDPAVFQEQSLCDTAIVTIIGETLSFHSKQLQEYKDLLFYFDGMQRDWTAELEQLETSALQLVLDSERYEAENAVVIEAGRVLVLLYVYRGGVYAINSLIGNGILESVENADLSSNYRTFLLYLILWIAETNLFGTEWLRIKDVIVKHALFSDAMKADFPQLFSI